MNAESTQSDITIDFQRDWAEILCQKLAEEGYSTDSNQLDSDKLCIQYFNLLKRRIDAKPREVLASKEFTYPKKYSFPK